MKTGRRVGRVWAFGTLLATPLAACVAVGWWFTAPATEPATSIAAKVAPGVTPRVEATTVVAVPARPVWPEERVEGEQAKRVLLAVLEDAERRLQAAPGYSARFRRRERLRGVLGPEQTCLLKIRHQPFAVYVKFLAPKAGKEVVFAEGHRDNKVIGHNGDWTRRLIPRLAVAPTEPLALADNRHPITDAGLLNLTRKLLHYRRMDLSDTDAITVLDRVVDDEGQEWLRSVHDHPSFDADRPFQYVEVHYDPENFLPRRIWSYDWPEPGSENPAERKLAESYRYDEIEFLTELTDHEFDPANPSYGFSRY